ncbi:MAG: NUDIX hydrolase [Candidatus Caccovivens sp.]
MDIKIDNEEGKFKFRVCGILVCDNKYLVVKMNANTFYCLPGGHVELDEDTDSAILREMREELGFDVKIKNLIAINQNFFKTKTGKPVHELGFYYVVEPVNKDDINKNDYEREELDKGKIQHLEFKWVSKQDLKEIDFKPAFVADCLDKKEIVVNINRD